MIVREGRSCLAIAWALSLVICAQPVAAQFNADVLPGKPVRQRPGGKKPKLNTVKSLQIQFNLSLAERIDKAGALAFLKKAGLSAKKWVWTGANMFYYRGRATAADFKRTQAAVAAAAKAAPKDSKEARASTLMAEHIRGDVNVQFKTNDKKRAVAALRKMGLSRHVSKKPDLWTLRFLCLKGLKAGQEWKTVETLMKDPLVECAEYNGVAYALD